MDLNLLLTTKNRRSRLMGIYLIFKKFRSRKLNNSVFAIVKNESEFIVFLSLSQFSGFCEVRQPHKAV
jgi:hypothetical protein